MERKKNGKPVNRNARRLRLGILGAVLAVSTILGLMHQYWPASKIVGVDALCPFGGIEAFYTLLTSGAIMKKLAVSSFILLGAVIGLSLLSRRAFCGQICPLGFLQEIFGKLGGLFIKRKPSLPAVIDKPARYLKYAVLAVIVGMSAYTSSLWFRPYDPWATYHHLLSPELLTEMSVGLGVLGIALVGSLVYDRFFCRYLCPMGGLLGAISPLSWFKVRRNAKTCIDCGACDKACPVNVKISDAKNVNNPECINCNECVNACPVKETLEVAAPNGKRVRPAAASLMAILILASAVGATTAAGWFGWTSKSLAKEVAEAGGKFDPELIKGKSTFREISEASGIPLSVFKEEFKLTDQDMDAELKTFEDRGFDPDAVRAFVEEFLKTGRATSGSTIKTQGDQTGAGGEPVFDTALIKGSTTTRQASEMSGVPVDALQDEFGITDGQLDTPIKDIKGIAGFAELDEFRAFISDYLNAKK